MPTSVTRSRTRTRSKSPRRASTISRKQRKSVSKTRAKVGLSRKQYSPTIVAIDYEVPKGRSSFTVKVVRDDLLPGGTKQRAMVPVLANLTERELVLPSANSGYAQVALAVAATATNKIGTAFIADRAKETAATKLARKFGGNIKPVRPGYMTVRKKRAQDYAAQQNKKKPGSTRLFALGADEPIFEETLLKELKLALPSGFRAPKRVWVAVGSGVLMRVLGQLWPNTMLLGVEVGMQQSASEILGTQRAKKSKIYIEEELSFDKETKDLPPWPSVANYDAKLWKYIKKYGQQGDLVWNVATI